MDATRNICSFLQRSRDDASGYVPQSRAAGPKLAVPWFPAHKVAFWFWLHPIFIRQRLPVPQSRAAEPELAVFWYPALAFWFWFHPILARRRFLSSFTAWMESITHRHTSRVFSAHTSCLCPPRPKSDSVGARRKPRIRFTGCACVTISVQPCALIPLQPFHVVRIAVDRVRIFRGLYTNAGFRRRAYA
jgi:hypothetical protein